MQSERHPWPGDVLQVMPESASDPGVGLNYVSADYEKLQDILKEEEWTLTEDVWLFGWNPIHDIWERIKGSNRFRANMSNQRIDGDGNFYFSIRNTATGMLATDLSCSEIGS